MAEAISADRGFRQEDGDKVVKWGEVEELGAGSKVLHPVHSPPLWGAVAQIPGHYTRSEGGVLSFNFVVYSVHVRTRDDRELSTDHRYSDFEKLWQQLGEAGAPDVPALPPKYLSCAALNADSFINDRKRGLQSCLQSLLSDRRLAECPEVQQGS